jgi:hypothetical protein
MCISLIALLGGSLLLGACGKTPDTGHVGPVGPQGSVGPQTIVGTPPKGLIVIENSSQIVTEEYDLAGFEGLEIGWGFNVDIRQGEGFRVVTRVEKNAAPYLHVAKEGHMLKLGLDPTNAYHNVNIVLEAEITMPRLTDLVVDSGSDVTMRGFESAEALDIFVSSGGSLRAESGSAGDLTVVASASGEVDLADFSVANANVEASVGSTVTVNPSGRLDARVGTGSVVYYRGDPTMGTIETDVAGGAVERK